MAVTDVSTRRVMRAYLEEATAPMFLSSQFRVTEASFHNSEKIEIDIQRDTEEIAIVIQDLSTGARQNELGPYSTKAFTPPIFDEELTINSFDLLGREPGESPFQDPVIQARAITRAFKGTRKLEKKVRRAIELQAAQVLQTGTITLKDAAGNSLYVLNFGPKATHFVTVGTPWAAGGATGNPFTDIAALAEVLRRDGRRNPSKLIFGSTAMTRFMESAVVKAQANNFGLQGLQTVQPRAMQGTGSEEGATFYGRYFIGNYWFDAWTYAAGYIDPQTGNYTQYVDPFKMIMLPPDPPLDLSFGAIPRIVAPEQRVLPFLPERISDTGRQVDLSMFGWVTPDGKHLKVSVGTRPLAIPTGIDTFGALTVGS